MDTSVVNGDGKPVLDCDVVVVGAGVGGLNSIHHLLKQGKTVRAFEAGSEVGGTWYWNKYPGARVDIESLEYSYGFSEEVQQEWKWPLLYSEQPSVLEYLNWVCDRLDLRKHIQFDTRVSAARFEEATNSWVIETDGGETVRCGHVVMALGFLCEPYLPEFPGLESFEGTVVHTARWPEDGIDLKGKSVGMIGTGASAVQAITAIAPEVGQMTIFQRTPNWCFPIRNDTVPAAYEAPVKASYAEVRRREYAEGFAGMILVDGQISPARMTPALDASDEEREAAYWERYRVGGPHIFFIWADQMSNLEANKTLADFLSDRIRERVADPETAAKLIPEHPIWSRRPPGESGFYEVFNQDNVDLVDSKANPIAGFTPSGIVMEDGTEHQLDVVVLATGFDAGDGALNRIDIRGRGDESLRERWQAEGVRTLLGMMVTGFPNMYILDGIQSPACFFSPPLLVDAQSRWISRVLAELDESGTTTAEPTVESMQEWVKHLNETAAEGLLPYAESWYVGTNIPGKEHASICYTGGFPEYEKRCDEALEGDVPQLVLDQGAVGRPG
jgi:cation diffusion facilitator CzcD-associated flavoprotein CzcO